MSQATNRELFRNLTGELDTGMPPNSTTAGVLGVDEYMQRGAEWLNDLVGYFWKDSTITVAAGAESDLPTDMIEVVFVTLDGFTLKATDIEQLNQANPAWRNAERGRPKEFYVYSKLGFYPPLDGGAASLVCTMRHLATPTVSSTPGFDLLSSQHQRIPIYYGVALWFEAHGLDGDGFRADRFMRLAQQEALGVKDYYERRKTLRGPIRGTNAIRSE